MLSFIFGYGLPVAAFWLVWRLRQQHDEARERERQRDALLDELRQRLDSLERLAQPSQLPIATETVEADAAIEPPLVEASALDPFPSEVVLPQSSLNETVPPETQPYEATPIDVLQEITPPVAPTSWLPRPQIPAIDWESFIGVQLFSWIAGLALVIAAVFFLRYSIDRGWLGPPIRVAIGLTVGICLLVFCELRAAQRYRVTANALDAAGIAILFATLFAAYALWDLLGQIPVFLAMTLVTAVAVLLSIRRDSLFIALLGLVGGFATPALLSTGVDRPVGLFGYLFLLNAGLGWVAYRKRWPLLTGLCVLITALYQFFWVAKFLDASRLPLAMAIFLVFPILHGATFLWTTRPREGEEVQPIFGQMTALAAALPLLLAAIMAVVPAFGVHFDFLFGYVLLIASGLAAIAILRGPHVLHSAGGMAVLLVTLLWLGASYQQDAWPRILVWLSLATGVYLAVPEIARRRGRPLEPRLRQELFAPLLLGAFPIVAYLEPHTADPGLLFGVLFGLAVLIGVVAVRREFSTMHTVAAIFIVATEAVWTVNYLAPAQLFSSLLVYVTFALFHLGLPALAARDGRHLTPNSRAALSGHLFLLGVALLPALSIPPWPLFVALAVLDLAFGFVALQQRRVGSYGVAIALSQLLLAIWVVRADAAPWPQVAMLSTCVVSAFAIVWIRLAERRQADTAAHADVAIYSLFLALLVHFLAAQQGGAPALPIVAAVHLVVLIALLAVVAEQKRFFVLNFAVAAAAVQSFVWCDRQTSSWIPTLLYLSAQYSLFLLLPVLLGRRSERSRDPYLASVAASVVFLLLARRVLIVGGHEDIIGVLPVTQALLLFGLLRFVLQLDTSAGRDPGRIALVAGAALGFATAAIPLQLEREWITIGWALEAAALAWLYTQVVHRGLLFWCSGLALAVFIRLALNPSVLAYHPRSAVPIWNWYLYTYAVAAAAMFTAAYFLRGRDDKLIAGIRAAPWLAGAATVLLFLLLNIEIADYYSNGSALTFDLHAGLSQDLTYTIGWAVFALALLGAGIAGRIRVARITALGLLVITIVKCFLLDLWRLGGLYRVGSFVGLAVCLSLVALLLQRFVLGAQKEAAE